MSVLKTASGYATDDSGAYIKIRLSATTTYGTSSASEANSDSAVYQSWPAAYAGTYTTSVGLTSAIVSWTDLATAADYGYATISGWKYGIKTGSDAYTFTVVAPSTLSVTFDTPPLTSGTVYTFFVEPLNQYQQSSDISLPWISPITFTTSAVPSAPTAVNVTWVGSSARISWTEPADPANPVTSYSVKFKKPDNSFTSISGVCQVSAASCTTTCSCDVLMTTLTTTLGWTIDTTEKYIEVEVYAKNIDGTSTAATIATPSTDSISYKYTP